MADKEPNWDALSKRNAEDTRVANEEAFFASGRKQAAEAEAAKKEAARNSPEAVAKREKDKADQEEKDRQGMIYAGQVRQAQQKAIQDAGKLKEGGFVPDYAKKVSLSSGGDGIKAAGGYDYTPRLKIGASVEEMQEVADMSNFMQAHRRAVKEYERLEREKKKNDGGLSAARQSVTTRSYFPDRPMFQIGATVYNPMTFEGFSGAHPVTGLNRSAEQGWCQNDPNGAMTPSLRRMVIQSGRKQRSTYLGGGG